MIKSQGINYVLFIALLLVTFTEYPRNPLTLTYLIHLWPWVGRVPVFRTLSVMESNVCDMAEWNEDERLN
jgi:hypothetical protein